MAALIGLVLFAQSLLGMPGELTWLLPGDFDTTVLEVDGTDYQIAFGPGCEQFAPEMAVRFNAGSGGVGWLTDMEGSGQCNVQIGAPIGVAVQSSGGN